MKIKKSMNEEYKKKKKHMETAIKKKKIFCLNFRNVL